MQDSPYVHAALPVAIFMKLEKVTVKELFLSPHAVTSLLVHQGNTQLNERTVVTATKFIIDWIAF